MAAEAPISSIVGYHQGGPRTVDMKMWNWKAIDVVNAHVRRRDVLMDAMRAGLDLEAKGLIDLGSLVTHRYGLSGVDQAYGDLASKPEGLIKAVIYPGTARSKRGTRRSVVEHHDPAESPVPVKPGCRGTGRVRSRRWPRRRSGSSRR